MDPFIHERRRKSVHRSPRTYMARILPYLPCCHLYFLFYVPISALMGHFWTLLSYLRSLTGPSIMLLYPLYASICALEGPSKLDDEQWLAYWILYSFLTVMEMVVQPILSWIPIWFQVKVAFVAWLVLPQFRGASFIYERFVREQLRKHGVKLVGSHPPPKKVEEELGQ